jgi:hypothetical protein
VTPISYRASFAATPASNSSAWTSSATSKPPRPAPNLLFHVRAERNEVASIIVTTNLPFGEWTRIFTDARLCKAVVDRLTFGAHIIETGTDSWRLRRCLEQARKERHKEPPT